MALVKDWISVPDSDVPVVYGDTFSLINGDSADENSIGHLKYVLNDVNDIRRSYVSLGFHLWEIWRLGIYKDFGYDNLKDFCINNVPVNYSILSRCISVYERFRDTAECGGYARILKPCYDGFSFSQLVELLGLSFQPAHLPRLKNYSVAKLRDLKKFCMARYGRNGYCSVFIDEYEASCDVATADPVSDNCDVATADSVPDNCDVAIADSVPGNCDVATANPVPDNLGVEVFSRLGKLKGAALQSFVRGFPVSHKINITVYDSQGKKAYGGSIAADVICFVGDDLCIRIPDAIVD